MIEMRAQKLVESKLFELAIKLTRHALRAIRACMNSHSLHKNLAALQHQCIMEIYYALLFKYQLRQQLESELMALPLVTANNFIESTIATINETNEMSMKNQSNPKRPDRKRSWLNRIKKPYSYMGHFALQFVIRRILNEEQPEKSSSQVLKNLLYLWINEHRNEANFESQFRELVQTKFQSRIYDCCEYFYERVNIIGSLHQITILSAIKLLQINHYMSIIRFKIYFQYPNDCEVALKVYITEINKEINELESHNYDYNMEATSIMEKEKEISKRYIFLAGVVKADSSLERECILTAFSMNPTEEFYALVCQLNGHRSQITTNRKEMVWNKRNEMASDLSNFIMGPRIKKLSWELPWSQLQVECEDLVRTEKKRRIIENSTATANEKLKFINLDYADFKNLAPQEIPGIHNGFEIFMPDDGDDQIIPKSNDSDDTDSAPEATEYIRKERKRVREKKRRLLKRRHRLLELNIEMKNDDNPADKKRRRTRMSGDSLKPVRHQKPKVTTSQSLSNKKLLSDPCDIQMQIIDPSTLDKLTNDTIITDISTHTHIQISDTSGDSKNISWPASYTHTVQSESGICLTEHSDQPTSDAILLCVSALNTINNSIDSNDSMGETNSVELGNFGGSTLLTGDVESNGAEVPEERVVFANENPRKDVLDLITKEILPELEDITDNKSSTEIVAPMEQLMPMDRSTPIQQHDSIGQFTAMEHERQTIATEHCVDIHIVPNNAIINDSKLFAEKMDNEPISKTKNPLILFRKKKKSCLAPMEQGTPENNSARLISDLNKVIANP